MCCDDRNVKSMLFHSTLLFSVSAFSLCLLFIAPFWSIPPSTKMHCICKAKKTQAKRSTYIILNWMHLFTTWPVAPAGLFQWPDILQKSKIQFSTMHNMCKSVGAQFMNLPNQIPLCIQSVVHKQMHSYWIGSAGSIGVHLVLCKCSAIGQRWCFSFQHIS
jgi:hypothetical protein